MASFSFGRSSRSPFRGWRLVRQTFFGVFVVAVTWAAGAPAALGQMEPQPVGEAERRAVVTRIAEQLEAHYVFPDVAAESGAHLRRRLEAGAFDEAEDPSSFAAALTAALQHVSRDKHMRVHVRPAGGAGPNLDPFAALDRFRNYVRDTNFGFERVERLAGNVGYLDLRGFAPVGEAGPMAVAAMRLLEHTDAVIFDLRQNGGGSPEMVRLLSSYFFDAPTHLNSLYWREGDRTEEFWTLEEVEGKQRPDVPVFVLTSRRTFSAAEEFTYNLKTRGRAVIVGETTGGGANPGGMFPVGDRFDLFVPTGYAVNPITGTNWEGVGVVPDVAVEADRALDVALARAQAAAETYRTAEKDALASVRETLQQEITAAEHLFSAGKTAEAEQKVAAVLRRQLDAGWINEQFVNLLGYDYLRHERPEMAVAVFRFNADAFPASPNVHDSLGDGYRAQGRLDRAAESYERALRTAEETGRGHPDIYRQNLARVREEMRP